MTSITNTQVNYLTSLGLPSDYSDLNPKNKRKARLTSLRSWYSPDPAKANILCTNTEAFVCAHRLWVEFYMKKSKWNAGVYHFTDPIHKYDMVRAAMSPAKTHKQPSKTAIVSPRLSTKTWTLIQEMCSMMAVVRTVPTKILISEINKDRTAEEMQTLRDQIENNEKIHSDFGGEGKLFPRAQTGGKRWNQSALQFEHGRNSIIGISTGAAHRGRHPIFGIIDDPEDDENSRSADFRTKYFRWLFKGYLNMFGPGAKIVWIGTLVHEFSCLQLAMRGITEKHTSEDEDSTLERDTRFDDWNRKRFQLISTNEETGERYSIFPDRCDVEDYDRYVHTHGMAAAMCEFQGIGMSADQFCFSRDPLRHGYMHCDGGSTDADYFLDLRTGITMPWKDFLESLYVAGAVDLADGVTITADPGAIVILGRSEDGVTYVLDCWNRRQHAPELVDKAFDMAKAWNVQKLGFEKAAMQSVVVNLARKIADDMRSQGLSPPLIRGIINNKIDKVRRIISALRPALTGEWLRFPCFESVTTSDDKTHKPLKYAHPQYCRQLTEQIDFYSDEGGTGHDDLADALEMALRMLGRAHGATPKTNDDPNVIELQKWADVGLHFTKQQIPIPAWTQEMVRDRIEVSPDGFGNDDEMDPYE